VAGAFDACPFVENCDVTLQAYGDYTNAIYAIYDYHQSFYIDQSKSG
jgi:hypothetical protein